MKISRKCLSRSLLLATLFALPITCGIGNADIIPNPDANTLWREDGTSAPTGKTPSLDSWNGDLDIKAVDGNLQINSPDTTKVNSGRYVQISSEFPYMVFKIHDYKPFPGYNGIAILLAGVAPTFGLVSQIQPGTYVFNLGSFFPPKPTTVYLSLYLYGGQLTMSDLSMVKVPNNRIDITSPAIKAKGFIEIGDELTFTVTLKEAAEDVTLNYFDSYTMPQLKINGEQTLQLKPTDASQKTWAATIKLKSIENLRSEDKGQLPADHLMVKALVLGGALKEPLWTTIPYPTHLQPPVVPAK